MNAMGRAKQVCVGHLLSVGSVETFDECVLGGLAGLNIGEVVTKREF